MTRGDVGREGANPVPPAFTGSCPIREHTADGHYVGRCYFATYGGECPRHGTLSAYVNNDDREFLAHARPRSKA